MNREIDDSTLQMGSREVRRIAQICRGCKRGKEDKPESGTVRGGQGRNKDGSKVIAGQGK